MLEPLCVDTLYHDLASMELLRRPGQVMERGSAWTLGRAACTEFHTGVRLERIGIIAPLNGGLDAG